MIYLNVFCVEEEHDIKEIVVPHVFNKYLEYRPSSKYNPRTTLLNVATYFAMILFQN